MATASKAAAPVCLESVGGNNWDLSPFMDVSISAGAFVVHLWSLLLIIWLRTAHELFNPDLRTSFSWSSQYFAFILTVLGWWEVMILNAYVLHMSMFGPYEKLLTDTRFIVRIQAVSHVFCCTQVNLKNTAQRKAGTVSSKTFRDYHMCGCPKQSFPFVWSAQFF